MGVRNVPDPSRMSERQLLAEFGVTGLVCEGQEAYGSTHHLRPRAAGRGLNRQECMYCGKTERVLREEVLAR